MRKLEGKKVNGSGSYSGRHIGTDLCSVVKYQELKNTYLETELANLQSHCMSIMTRAVVSALIDELMGQAYGSASILLGDAITILSRLSLSFVFHLQAEHE